MQIIESIKKLLLQLEQHQWLANVLLGLAVALVGIWLAKRLANAFERLLNRFKETLINPALS